MDRGIPGKGSQRILLLLPHDHRIQWSEITTGYYSVDPESPKGSVDLLLTGLLA